MFYHLFSVGAAILLGLWSTTIAHYQEFRTPPATPSEIVSSTQETKLSTPNPFETVVGNIVRSASSTPVAPGRTPVPTHPPQTPVLQTPVPSKPFTPLPVPPSPVVPATTTPAVTPPLDARASDEALLKGAIVNVICLPGGGIRGSSGSGVVIDPRGIVLTVAHVGQNFLLRDYPTKGAGTCYIRTGSPAKNAYAADLIYVSPSWIHDNTGTFLSSRPTGTGEDDFAIIAITGSLTSTPLPKRFAFIPLSPSGTNIDTGDMVGTGSYGAEFLTSSEVRSSLYPTIKFAKVEEVYTFDNNTDDIFSVAAGSAAQESSSGGAVMNADDRLIGLITTRTVRPDLSMRLMQALTMDHLRRSFKRDMRENLDAYLKGDVSILVANFRGKAVGLLDTLSEAIDEAKK